MKSQEPAEGVMITKQFPDAVYYTVACSCGNPDDSIEFCVEIDEDTNEVVVHTYSLQKTAWWEGPLKQVPDSKNWFLYQISYRVRRWVNSFVHRAKTTWTVWTKGYVEYQATTYMSKQHALNYAAAIEYAVKKLDRQQKR